MGTAAQIAAELVVVLADLDFTGPVIAMVNGMGATHRVT